MYRSILVPLDGSKFGEHALPLALSIARRAQASVQLVYVHAPLTPVYVEGSAYLYADLDTHVKDEKAAYLKNVADRLAGETSVKILTMVLEGAIPTTLAEHAARTGVDLVVMTTHGRGPFGRFWLGSVADEVLRHITMPLLLIHPKEEEADTKEVVDVKHLLLALDGTPLSEKMLSPAAELAVLLGAKITLLRVISPILPLPYPAEVPDMGTAIKAVMDKVDVLQAQLHKEAETYLAKVAARLKERGVDVNTDVEVNEQPAVAILEAAKSCDCDLIAVETHGRHGLSRLFLGSVADKVIRGSSVPVLAHRPVS